MAKPTLRTLQRALKVAGGRAPLCAALGVTAQDLDAYLAERAPLPNEVFLRALDIVAGRWQPPGAASARNAGSRARGEAEAIRRLLAQALEALGPAALEQRLRVPIGEIREWLDGRGRMPETALLELLALSDQLSGEDEQV